MGPLGPRGVYQTLTDLQNAFPTGTEGTYVVSENGHWYYWNGTSWADGGVYETNVIADGSITTTKIADKNVTLEKINVPSVAVKCVDIRRNTSGEGGLLGFN